MLSLLLSACQSHSTDQTAKCQLQQKCVDVITNTLVAYNIAVIQAGETIAIEIPVGQLFNENTANFTSNARPVLAQVANLILQYQTELIKVAAYADNSMDKNRAIAVTQQQAENIVRYFTLNGLNSRVLYAAGYGQGRPAAMNDGLDHYKNQRIEIVFRYIPRNVDREDEE